MSVTVPGTSIYEQLSVSLNESLTNGPTASQKNYISKDLHSKTTYVEDKQK